MLKLTTINTITAISCILVGALYSTGSTAKNTNEPEITFDDGTSYDRCILAGGSTKDHGSTYSCSVGGKTTTCDKRPTDRDAICSTEIQSAKSSISKPRLEQFSSNKNTPAKRTSRFTKIKTKMKSRLAFK